ncbi:MAG: sulfatase-like hydrolase/transferase, partial [Planctomycetota bacterium]
MPQIAESEVVRFRARRRALGCVAALNFAYALAAGSPYALACLPPDAGAASFTTAAGVLVVEVLLVSLPAWVAGWILWRARRRRAATIVCLALLVTAGFLLRADALMFPLFRQHAYGALAVGCLLQGDPAALAVTPAQAVLYGLEGLAVVGLQWPAFLLLRWFFRERLPMKSSPRLRAGIAAGCATVFLLALGAWAQSRYAWRREKLLAMQRGMLVPLAGRERVPVPAGIAAAAERAAVRAASRPAARPAWLEPLEISGGPERRPNIVLIVAESFRLDALNPETAPEMWRLAGSAARAERHYAGGNTTYLALFSLAWGQDPAAWDAAVAGARPPPPLAALKKCGYSLHAVSAASLNWWGLDKHVFPREMFDTFLDRRGDPVRDDLSAVEDVLRVIDGARTGEPFFLVYFPYSTHWSYYFPPECERFRPSMRNVELKIGPELVRSREELVNRYRNAAFFVDRCAGRVVRRLEERGLTESTVVVFCGDHGESLHETGSFCHGASLADQEVRTPMVVRWPGAAPRVLP